MNGSGALAIRRENDIDGADVYPRHILMS